jgi:endonuclease III
MSRSRIKNTVRILLQRYGRTFAEDLGIQVEQNQLSPLYCLLTSAALFSTRISHNIALKSARILFEHGWTTAERMAASTWEQRVRALDEGGYVRYDERTATMLGQTAQMLIDNYQGDLRKLRQAAGADPVRERTLLDRFPGVGDVAVNIFFREAQLAWPELFPFADEKTLASAARLNLPVDAIKLAALVRNRRNYVRLVSALIRVQLERKHDEIFTAARAARERDTSAGSRVIKIV